MDYTEAVAYLDNHIGHGVKPGLDRISDLLEMMGSPHEGYPLLHIAGTNGKTSTARMATAILVAHDLSTGTYTSPHLQAVEERLAINGRFSTEEEFALAISDVAAFADLRERDGQDPNTYFELTTAAAFAFFAEQAVSVGVLEVGLGGRLDATNVIEADVCTVTSIGRDHTEYLGTELSQIAAEKLAIAGSGSILVTGDLPDEASSVAVTKARDLGIQHRRLGEDFSVGDAERGLGGWLTTIHGAEETYEDVFLPLHGRHQLDNLAVAVASVEALIGSKLDEDALRDGLNVLTMPGRMEAVSTNPLVLLDGAHNVDGIKALSQALKEEFPSTRWQILFGVMGDKDVSGMIDELSPVAEGIVVTEVDYGRAMPVADLAERIQVTTDVPLLLSENSEYGLDMARAEAGHEGAVLVAGSLYLVGEVRDLLDG